jgi:hypothetical protein
VSTSREQERVAESQRLIEELDSFNEELNSWEKSFVYDISEKITKYGKDTHLTDTQFDKLSQIYRRLIEK